MQTLLAPPQETGLAAQRASGVGGREAAPPPPYGTSGGCTNIEAGVGRTPTLGVSLPHHLSTPLPSVPVLPAPALVPSVLSNPVSTKQLEIVCKADLLKTKN